MKILLKLEESHKCHHDTTINKTDKNIYFPILKKKKETHAIKVMHMKCVERTGLFPLNGPHVCDAKLADIFFLSPG